MIVTIASGKGGVGKSNFVANLGLALSEFGVDTIILDSNLTNGDLSCILGPPFPKRTIHDVLNRDRPVSEAVFDHPLGVKTIASSLSLEDSITADPGTLTKMAEELNGLCDVVIVDAPGTLGQNTIESVKLADKLILLTTPEITAYSNALKTKKLADKEGVDVLGSIVNKVRKNFETVGKEAQEWLGVQTLTTLPYDENLIDAVEHGRPVLKHAPYTDYSIKMREFAANLANVEYARPALFNRVVWTLFKYKY